MIPYATDEQITAVVKEYIAEMRRRGHPMTGETAADVKHLERAARIHDVWRVAFARIVPPALLSLDSHAEIEALYRRYFPKDEQT